jgi:hypothetical protein
VWLLFSFGFYWAAEGFFDLVSRAKFNRELVRIAFMLFPLYRAGSTPT